MNIYGLKDSGRHLLDATHLVRAGQLAMPLPVRPKPGQSIHEGCLATATMTSDEQRLSCVQSHAQVMHHHSAIWSLTREATKTDQWL